jgi:hypothetical protein
MSTISATTIAYGASAASDGARRLDYDSRDRGPFRTALLQVAAVGAPAADSLPAPAAVPPTGAAPVMFEGADALAALSRDLAGSASATPLELASSTVPAAEGAGPEIVAAAEETAAVTDLPPSETVQPGEDTPALTPNWSNDEFKGRRLGDQPMQLSGGGETESWLFGEDGFGFDDLLDIVNPLQHIPVVSSLYRWITGDEIAPAASIAGGALFGGPIGAAGAVAGVAIAEATGRDLGEHAIAMVFGDDSAPASATDLAALDPAPVPPAMSMPAEAPQIAAAAMPGEADFLPLRPSTAPVAAQLSAPMPSQAFTGGIPVATAPAVFIPAQAMPPVTQVEPSDPSSDDTPADAAIAAQMMDALDKYDALVRARVGSAPSIEPAAGSLYDSTL